MPANQFYRHHLSPVKYAYTFLTLCSDLSSLSFFSFFLSFFIFIYLQFRDIVDTNVHTSWRNGHTFTNQCHIPTMNGEEQQQWKCVEKKWSFEITVGPHHHKSETTDRPRSYKLCTKVLDHFYHSPQAVVELRRGCLFLTRYSGHWSARLKWKWSHGDQPEQKSIYMEGNTFGWSWKLANPASPVCFTAG